MKYKVMYTAGAKRDLRNIFRYISEELLAPENAAGQTDRIMAAIRKLDTMPNRNRLYEEEPWHSRGLRFFPVDNYLVFYKTNDESQRIVFIADNDISFTFAILLDHRSTIYSILVASFL